MIHRFAMEEQIHSRLHNVLFLDAVKKSESTFNNNGTIFNSVQWILTNLKVIFYKIK